MEDGDSFLMLSSTKTGMNFFFGGAGGQSVVFEEKTSTEAC